jgi:hypothetical protein
MGMESLDAAESKIRWGIEQRLEFIEFRLFWDGELKRGDITERFGVSTPQASADVATYREKAPANIVYDGSRKRFLATPKFRPRFLKPNADRYLAQLGAIADHVISLDDTWIGAAVATEVMPLPRRKVDAGILKAILMAVRANRSIDIEHMSMNRERPERMWRRITPHAFAHDGLRWHVRAFCHIDEYFKDFVLSRCLGVGKHGEPGAEPNTDKNWFSFLDVVLEPNPELSERDRRTIAHDYDMEDGRVTVPVRRALLYYFEKRLRLDAAKTIGDPIVAPLTIVNHEEVKNAIPSMKSDSDLLT